MCDVNCKRPASGFSPSCCKRVKQSLEKESYKTCSAGESSCSSSPSYVGPQNERLQPVANIGCIQFPPSTSLEYSSGLPLQPEELLLYSLITVSSPGRNINSVKGYSPEKFAGISNAILDVYDINFDCVKLRNYFYRSINNTRKGLGKFNGVLRWRYYALDVNRIVTKYQNILVNLLVNNNAVGAQDYKDLRDGLNSASVSASQELEKSKSLAYKVSKSNYILAKFPKWKVVANIDECEVHLHYFGSNLTSITEEYKVTIFADGTYKFIFGGKPRETNLNYKDNSPIHNLNDLYSFMEHLERYYLCPGVQFDDYKDRLHDISGRDTPVFKTVAGEPAAYVEPLQSNLNLKVIRSTKCSLMLEADVRCEACTQVNHYMRTIKSRKKTPNESTSKFVRFDYMKKDTLVENSRQMAERIHLLETRVERLQERQETMSSVGKATDSDFRTLFQQLYSGLNKVKEKHDNKTCYWQACGNESEFESKDLLMKHIRTCHMTTMEDVAPICREYTCRWLSCMKSFRKKHLLENHIIEHIGSESDLFLVTLLKDQAKALNTPSKQMRWHPSVLKWCLRVYSRSHSLYSDLRDSGFLKLPSGRTLSDYKNFCSSKSGWQISVLGAMRDTFNDQGYENVGKFGGLFFDEVKIKEGLLFDPSSWELIGFVDLDDNIDTVKSSSSVQETLATHALQFYFKSLFSSFSYPCGYFLTRGISASTLNRVFWQGVSLLHAHGFTVLLTGCDGAAENRAFMVMNGCSEDNSKTINPFSKQPLVFMSDPPHLLKKLRNNIYNSGYKEESARYSRCMILDSTPILWNHIYSVYQRDKQRHLFSTDIRSSHVHLDSLSKMRVKLAVQVLNSKVRKDMENYEPTATLSTQKYICYCEKLWDVFNDTKPLFSVSDPRLLELNNVLLFFRNWRDQLSSQSMQKSERASCFISWQTMFDLQISVNGLRELVAYIDSPTFKAVYGSHYYIIPKRLSQDIVESFFSLQRQSCGGSSNMTAYAYGYNVNSAISYQAAKSIAKKQTNVFQVDAGELCKVDQANNLRRRVNVDSIFSQNMWAIQI